MSPEQASDSGSADIRSDLYSLGCTWFHMLSGRTPFGEGGLADRILAHMQEDPPDVRKYNPRVSDALVAVLNKLLAKDPDDRYQSAQELVQALQELNPTREAASQSDCDTVEDAPRKKGKSGGKGKKPRSTTPEGKKPSRKKSRSVLWIAVGRPEAEGYVLGTDDVLVVFTAERASAMGIPGVDRADAS